MHQISYSQRLKLATSSRVAVLYLLFNLIRCLLFLSFGSYKLRLAKLCTFKSRVTTSQRYGLFLGLCICLSHADT